VVRYSRSTNEADVAGSPGSLSAIAEFLERGHGSITTRELSDPAPYEVSLTGIDIRRTESSKVSIGVADAGRLLITGELSPLGVLGANLRELAANGGPDEHLHVEYFPDHFYLDESSVPVVFRVERS
jgi:hypothetical protein